VGNRPTVRGFVWEGGYHARRGGSSAECVEGGASAWCSGGLGEGFRGGDLRGWQVDVEWGAGARGGPKGGVEIVEGGGGGEKKRGREAWVVARATLCGVRCRGAPGEGGSKKKSEKEEVPREKGDRQIAEEQLV